MINKAFIKFLDQMAKLGHKLVDLHLLKAAELNTPLARFQGQGDSKVEKLKYDEKESRLYINKSQYFENISPEVWEYQVGGYQVCEKWLKDRRERTLSYDDQLHYAKVVTALQETIPLMAAIDAAIPKWPVE